MGQKYPVALIPGGSTTQTLGAANICYGGGFKYGFAPHLDLTVDIARAELSKNGSNWYIMPASVSVSYAYASMPGKREKNYIKLGMSNLFTNLSATDAGGLAYGVMSGIESPAGDNASFFEEGFILGKKANSTDFSQWIGLIKIGYRFNIFNKKTS